MPLSSKNTRFYGSISLIFSQYSTLNFWNLSVAAWRLYHVFFYDVFVISAALRHIAVRLTQCPVLSANNSHNSTKVASGCSATSSLISVSQWLRWLNCGFLLGLTCKEPSIPCCFISFWTRLLRSTKPGGYLPN